MIAIYDSRLTIHELMKCPICGKPVAWQGNPVRPFCSERCKLIDFGGWVNEEYAVPSEEVPPSVDEAAPGATQGHDGGAHAGRKAEGGRR